MVWGAAGSVLYSYFFLCRHHQFSLFVFTFFPPFPSGFFESFFCSSSLRSPLCASFCPPFLPVCFEIFTIFLLLILLSPSSCGRPYACAS